MNDKIGRNDPCPCGSGRKYKHCHGREESNVVALPDDGGRAVERAMRWLHDYRRKAFASALDALFDAVVLDAGHAPATGLDEEFAAGLQVNLIEWLLAEGTFVVKGRSVRIADELLGPDGPGFSPAQRQRIEQLRAQPLRMYTVTDVRAGVGMTLCDALDTGAEAVEVDEDLGSRAMKPGVVLGARILQLGARRELSGAMYAFALQDAAPSIDAVRAAEGVGADAAERRTRVGREIMRRWVQQFTTPRRLPKIMDAASGEPMLLITDHYRVLDAGALAAALAACADVHGDAQQGWRREFTGSDGLARASAVVNPGRKSDRIEVFYRTQRQADEGRPWFEAVAGPSVAHLTREVTDPQGALAGGATAGAGARVGAPADALPPEAMAEAVRQVLGKAYANWCDEPIPALEGKTPRQAIATPAGLERVKGLLRRYEDSEREQSAAQGRPAFSFRFLWDQLGIE
jgi:hypothetical protein